MACKLCFIDVSFKKKILETRVTMTVLQFIVYYSLLALFSQLNPSDKILLLNPWAFMSVSFNHKDCPIFTLNTHSTHLVLFPLTLQHMFTVMIYISAIWCHPKEDGKLWFESGFSSMIFFLASLTSALLIMDLNLHPGFCKASLGSVAKKKKK